MLESANTFLALVPLVPAAFLALSLVDNPLKILERWLTNPWKNRENIPEIPPVSSQLLAYLLIGIAGYFMTNKLVPRIKQYTLRKGICGKDLGKRGTSNADKDVPEALGIVAGTVFVVCLIFCLVGYATSNPGKVGTIHLFLFSSNRSSFTASHPNFLNRFSSSTSTPLSSPSVLCSFSVLPTTSSIGLGVTNLCSPPLHHFPSCVAITDRPVLSFRFSFDLS
jgi:hypothetical protein